MARHSKNTSAAKTVRKAQKQATRAARRASADQGSLSAAPSTHIKRHTKGTSNEISFSVLHALRARADQGGSKRTHGVALTPKTMAELASEEARDEAHAALGLANPSDEVSLRKNERARKRAVRIGAVAFSCALALSVVAFTVFSSMSMSQQRHDQLSEAVALIEEADTALFTFDSIVVSAMSSSLEQMVADETALRYEASRPTLEGIEEQMQNARDAIERVQGNLASATDREAANQMIATLNARRALIESGEKAMDETVVVIDLYESVNAGWNGLLDADALARDAAALSAYTTTATLEAALAKTDEAIDAFAVVRASFAKAKEDVAEQLTYQAGLHDDEPSESASEASVESDPVATLNALDAALGLYLEYVDLRIDAQYEAKRSTRAVIDHDAAVAQEANDAYNSLDSQAVSLIRTGDDQPLKHVVRLYELEREELFSGYEQARLRASQADAYLSEYLAGVGR